MATHSSILPWVIPWTEEPGGCSQWGCKESEATDQLSIHAKILFQFSSVAQSCPTLCNPMDCSMPGFSVHHQLPELAQTMSIESVMSSNHLILCCPLLFLLSIFPSIRVFSIKSALCIRGPKYSGASAGG